MSHVFQRFKSFFLFLTRFLRFTRAQQLLRWATVCPKVMGQKWGLLCPFLGELGPHLAQCGLGRGLPPY